MDDSRFFSSRLENWLKSKQPKTLEDLVKVFYEKSFAVSLLILMFIPALPLPTGGVTHIFEIIAILLSFEMILGRKTVWLPKRWQEVDISSVGKRKIIPTLIKKLKWAERHSKPRLNLIIKNTLFLRVTGIFLSIFCLTAFLAPPFSGLDTLPSLAAVLITLSMIFEDAFFYVAGIIVGIIGISTVLVLGTVIFRSFNLWS